MTNIVYVDSDDNVIGAGPSIEAQTKGITHRVSRVFLFNSKGELLLQKRADHLRVNPGKWSESACGHVDEGETYLGTAERELKEEIGVSDIKLQEIKKLYDEGVGPSWIWKRFNMLYRGAYNGEVRPNPKEVSKVRWIMPDELRIETKEHPERFTKSFLKYSSVILPL